MSCSINDHLWNILAHIYLDERFPVVDEEVALCPYNRDRDNLIARLLKISVAGQNRCIQFWVVGVDPRNFKIVKTAVHRTTPSKK